MQETVKCHKCGFSTSKNNLERLCSNCFACTGCVRYVCPQCGEEIIEIPIQGFRMKKK